jgi:hypothetical protein
MVNLGNFGNEYAANMQILAPLAVTLFFLLLIFGYFYNQLMDKLIGKEHTSVYVAGGVLMTLAAGALISWKSAALFLILFALDGVFMVVGEFRRTEQKHALHPRRKRLPYAANGLIDDAQISAHEIYTLAGKAIEKNDAEKITPLVLHKITNVLLKLHELKNIQDQN